jgi:hypothetical protein
MSVNNLTILNKSIIIQPVVLNQGAGAGGANTILYGKIFEEKTNNQKRLITMGFIQINFMKKYNYLKSSEIQTPIIFILQSGLKKYIKYKYNINLFRCPDEAYIIENHLTGKKIVKILEKKEQNVEGSVETKLWSGPSLKREYELVLGNDFEVHYGFCVSSFLKKKLESTITKYVILNQILRENNIQVLFGDDDNYFEKLDEWIKI